MTALAFLHLLQARPSFQFHGLVFAYSAFDLTNSLPQTRIFSKDLVLTRATMQKYYEAFLPEADPELLRDPSVSPLFADLRSLAAKSMNQRLPPALFLCGTQDLLLDDTVLMSAKWQMTGAEAVTKIYPGAPHGFTLFDSQASDAAEEGRNHMTEFLTSKL